ncbi:MAG: prepilin-type N-terminal cleavage/methylation domain-containing protein [Candidatus Azotimanducaceae bacterium]|jgi:prepilin-type N-terminal cleavage/methylation domain-containing protein
MKQHGFSLIELMIGVGIIGVLATLALPAYRDYLDTARQVTMLKNMETIRLFEEDARLSTGSYVAGTYDPLDPENVGGLKALIDWEPRTTVDEITYVVDNVAADGFRITATHVDGTVVARDYSRP